MDTSSNFRVIDLEGSQHPEDRDLAAKAQEVVVETVEKLKPILRYVCGPVPLVGWLERECENPNITVGNVYQSDLRAIRIMEIAEPYMAAAETLFLRENGNFFTATRCKVSRHQEHYHLGRTEAWKVAPFGKFIAHLREMLRRAEEKRQIHLHSIQERREKLDEILLILKK